MAGVLQPSLFPRVEREPPPPPAPEPVAVVLTRPQLLQASQVGAWRKAMHRYAAFENAKRPDTNQQRGGKDLDSWDEVEAACAEYAVALTTGRWWPADFRGKQKTVDIPPDIEVRWTKYQNGHLLLYDEDPAEFRYVLVSGFMPQYRIHGWLKGAEGMQQEFCGSLREDRPPCFRVPHYLLRPAAELIVR